MSTFESTAYVPTFLALITIKTRDKQKRCHEPRPEPSSTPLIYRARLPKLSAGQDVAGRHFFKVGRFCRVHSQNHVGFEMTVSCAHLCGSTECAVM